MPRICEFYGIVIYMYYLDHYPAHFHAVYSQYEATVEIDGPRIMAGYLPPRALALTLEWARRYQSELFDDWERARRREPLAPLPPLD